MIFDIPIEERNSEELSQMEGLDEKGDIKKIQIYPKKSKAMNLAFDVTPAKSVSYTHLTLPTSNSV